MQSEEIKDPTNRERDDHARGVRKPYAAPSVETAAEPLNALLASGCPVEVPLQE